MKKNHVKRIAGVAQALVLGGALALVGCADGTYTPPIPDTEDFGPGATVAQTFTVANAEQLGATIEEIKNGGNNKNYVIIVSGNITVTDTFRLDSFHGQVSIRGTGTVTLSNPAEWELLEIKENQTIILRGPTLKGGASSQAWPRIVNVADDGIFVMRSGTIDASSLKHGVYVDFGGSFEMFDGTITGSEDNAVNVNGTFIMNDGIIIENHAGVWVKEGSGRSFTMNGGSITKNSGGQGAGVGSGASFTMTGGTISENDKGVHVSGTFTMTGGNIGQNDGMGVDVDSGATFTMTGGTISQNDDIGVGVGSGASFTMTSGTISNHSDGHGVYVGDGGTFALEGGTISQSGNSGIYIADGATSVTMAGGSITNNDEGVHLAANDAVFTMTGGSIFTNQGHGVFIESGATFNLNPPAAKDSIFENTDNQVNVVSGGIFLVNSVNENTY